MISSIIFTILLLCGGYLFYKNASKIRRNVILGKEIYRSDNSSERWKLMTLVAIGQSKMVVRPVAGIMHILLYAGFVIINIEVIEIVIDGIFGTHRVLSFMGGFYNFLIASFEWLALGVIVGCVVFFVRRNVIKLQRFMSKELDGWPRSDANYILITEVLLMSAFLIMNSADFLLQGRGYDHFIKVGSFPISSIISPLFASMSSESRVKLLRGFLWFEIIGIISVQNNIT
ncbi:MAG: hypothetical protein ACK5T9_02455 [Bacteroidota bacterium]